MLYVTQFNKNVALEKKLIQNSYKKATYMLHVSLKESLIHFTKSPHSPDLYEAFLYNAGSWPWNAFSEGQVWNGQAKADINTFHLEKRPYGISIEWNSFLRILFSSWFSAILNLNPDEVLDLEFEIANLNLCSWFSIFDLLVYDPWILFFFPSGKSESSGSY